MTAPLLQVEKASKQFGGLRAVDCASLDVAAGAIIGLIGPNGAGKTTLFALISGFETPTSGAIRFKGEDIAGKPAHIRARLGIARTFQIVRPFAGLSVRENIAVGAHLRHRARDEALQRAEAVARLVGLADKLDAPASGLTVAGRKQIGRASCRERV